MTAARPGGGLPDEVDAYRQQVDRLRVVRRYDDAVRILSLIHI